MEKIEKKIEQGTGRFFEKDKWVDFAIFNLIGPKNFKIKSGFSRKYSKEF